MTARDRMVLLVLAIAGLLAAAWFLVVTAERDRATRASADLSVAQARLGAALATVQAARAAESSFADNVTAVNLLTRAVPPVDDVAATLKQLERVARQDGVDFRSLKLSVGAGTAPTAAPATPGAATTPGAAAAPTLPSVTYALDFFGKFLQLQRFVGDVRNLALVNGKNVHVTGRLINITAVKLIPNSTITGSMDATVTAVDYTLPAGQSPAQVIASLRALGGSADSAQAALAQANASTGATGP